MKVIKRNGAETDFDSARIINAVSKANDASVAKELGAVEINKIAEAVKDKVLNLGRTVTVEEIQDFVELEIMKAGAFHVAQGYAHYRDKRKAERTANTTDGKMMTIINYQNEEVLQENSNKNPTINSVMRDYIAGEVSRDLTERLMLQKQIGRAHV